MVAAGAAVPLHAAGGPGVAGRQVAGPHDGVGEQQLPARDLVEQGPELAAHRRRELRAEVLVLQNGHFQAVVGELAGIHVLRAVGIGGIGMPEIGEQLVILIQMRAVHGSAGADRQVAERRQAGFAVQPRHGHVPVVKGQRRHRYFPPSVLPHRGRARRRFRQSMRYIRGSGSGTSPGVRSCTRDQTLCSERVSVR